MDYSGGWKSRKNPSYWRSLRDGCGALRRPGTAVLRRRLQGARRDVLGAAGVAAEPADAGLRAVDGEAARRRAPRLALERRAAEARGLPALDVRTLDPGTLRPAALPRPAGLRDADAVRDACATSGRGTSPSTRSTRTTAPAGSTTLRSRRIRGTAASATRSCRSAPPSGYPSTKPNGNGLGKRHRVSAIGPGVTPIVQTVLPRLRRYDAAAQREATRRFDADPRRRRALRSGAVSARPQGKRSVPGARSSSPPFRHSGGTRYAGADFAWIGFSASCCRIIRAAVPGERPSRSPRATPLWNA